MARQGETTTNQLPLYQNRLTIDDLLKRVAGYLPETDLILIKQAYDFAVRSHGDQARHSGEPYVTHPLVVATILAELRLDVTAIIAALLHDVPEDTDVGLSEIRSVFGEETAKLVDGVTKLSRIDWMAMEQARSKRPVSSYSDDETSPRAENLRKMVLAMAEDIRVILIKLADRLHNMRTLAHLPLDKQRSIAQETLEVYAPLASRLGIWQMKWQLEDLAFRHVEPEKYHEIATMLVARRTTRERYINQVISILQQELERAGIRAEISGRPKHIYSIYRKMQTRGVDFSQMYDLLAVRVLVDDVPDCYHAIGVVHSLWHPIPGQFDDYIAMPKESLYQSLHTAVIGPEGKPLEIQIRTHEMHRVAEYGVAAHWRYKEGSKRDIKFEEKIAWLRQLIEWQKEMAGAQEFVESLKADIFRDRVYVFTPRGEIKDLPVGATPLDFAYRIHTDVGHHCIGAKVNGRLVPLDYELKSGEIVEILTSKSPRGPSRDWLNPNLGYVKTAHAREKIRQWFKRQQREENIARGREQIEKELSRLGLSNEKLEDIAKLAKYDKVDDFLAAVGYGDVNLQHIAVRLTAQRESQIATPSSGAKAATAAMGIQVMGVGDLLTSLARCCNPVPGDDIVGFITRGRGVTIHRKDCYNVQSEDERERLVNVAWGRAGQQVYPVPIRIEAWDRDGLVRDVATVIAEDRINILSMNVETHPDRTATIKVSLEISSIDKLSRVLAKLEGIKDVSSVTRDHS
ncbi:MAG: bifunctional (p)ppGpp synthetase/guanosine-3',5'-bis(diphosphate) 3'-pyrophosphohydrolase [Chloroflexi bacterium]|nr:bifunctional (p)ppGpp synthetase/guanosine-3',5'-bis(diphosphate) 3'-pyrophosphohydrolase [Chloroflexota bacterium]MCL5074039.1 bifunctional (p)ppGpp synthetase/guanosine-3',5'-bis(diphosphate) 3'-pyrophosphohydrolase [Chloroflexota bacterium]